MSFEGYKAKLLVSHMPEPTNDNFIDWNWSLHRTSMLTDVWSCIFAPNHNGECPPPNDTTYYTKKAKQACSLISGAAGSKNSRVTDPFLDLCNPMGMYDAIVTKYSTKTVSNHVKRLLKMMSIQKELGEEWETTIKHIKSALSNVTSSAK